MPRSCITRKCILLNCAYNLALNNFLSGLSTLYQATIHDMLGGFISIGLGALLIVGVRKQDASVLFSFLLLESMLLGCGTTEAVLGIVNAIKGTTELNIFGILMVVGVFVSWVFMGGVFVQYTDFRKEKEADTENELAKSVAV